MSVTLGGLPKDYDGTDSFEEKTKYGEMLKDAGYSSSSEQITIKKNPCLERWNVGYNFEYEVMPDDIERYTDAILDARKEAVLMVEAHKKTKGFENVYLLETASYFGVREGRRVFGEYRLTTEDIVEGKRFEDGICLVTTGVDLHKTGGDDTTDCERGIKAKPYHIPYRCLVPKGSDNMLLAGRCISGDFFPFASYRMIGNMGTVGEAAGYAASLCVKEKITPKKVDGKEVSEYMKSLGNEL